MNRATTRRRDEAGLLLRGLLGHGPVPVSDIMAYATAAGLGWETVRKARVRLGIKSAKHGGRFGGDPRWFWEMPEEVRVAEDASIRPESSVSAKEVRQDGVTEPSEELKAEGSPAEVQPDAAGKDVRPTNTPEKGVTISDTPVSGRTLDPRVQDEGHRFQVDTPGDELRRLYGREADAAAKFLASRESELYLRGLTRFHLRKRGLPSGKDDVLAVIEGLRGKMSHEQA
ncbi:MAG: hypothetical protein JXO72_14915 [Vicinamibacteria bacterium]|nr:hypothetical protein [Vicinamibacteria bacterium]